MKLGQIGHLFSLLCTALIILPSLAFGRPLGHELTIQVEGSGTVNKNPEFPGYPDGSVVTLTAIPAGGWLFSHWSSDVTGQANPVNITMNGDKNVRAHFVISPSYSLTITKVGEGNVVLDPSGGTYLSNSVVRATATPAEGWVFVGWSQDASGTSNSVEIRMDNNKQVTATFAEKPAIVGSPSNVSAEIGDDVVLSVTARGAAPLFYQWAFEGVRLENQNSNTLTLDNVQATQSGTYTITVTNLYGSATASARVQVGDGCSGTNVVTEPTEAALREAIQLGGEVRLCFNGTVTLSQPITVSKDVILDARNRNVTISGNNSSRIFIINTNVTFAATNLALANGKHIGANGLTPEVGLGGAILNQGGTIRLTGCLLYNNQAIGGNGVGQGMFLTGADGKGGAIFSQGGTVVLLSTTLSNNMAWGGKGGSSDNLFSVGTSGNSLGGALMMSGGNFFLQGSTVVSNSTSTFQGGNGQHPEARGGAVYLESVVSHISGTLFTGNQAVGGNTGGFIFEYSGPAGSGIGGALVAHEGSLQIAESKFLGNSALGGFGSRSTPAGAAEAGAIFADTALICSNVIFTANIAASGNGGRTSMIARGGAISNRKNAMFDRSLISSNLVQGGSRGADMNGTFPGSHAEGGAIFNYSSLALTNTTIAENKALGGNGNDLGNPGTFVGLGGNASGGGIYNLNSGSVTVMNVTVATNQAILGEVSSQAPTAANIFNAEGGTFTLVNSLIAYPNAGAKNVLGVLVDGGHNISSDDSANFNSGKSFNFTDPKLEPLADNGGNTYTMALATNSPAIDFGNSLGAPSIDQRGYPRPVGNGYDIGAYEFSSTETGPPILTISLGDLNQVQITFNASANTNYAIQKAGQDFVWSTFETLPASSTAHAVSAWVGMEGDVQFFRVITIP